MDSGPKISGVEKRVIKYSNALACLNASFILLAIKLLAIPGGPSKKTLSPLRAASKQSRIAD